MEGEMGRMCELHRAWRTWLALGLIVLQTGLLSAYPLSPEQRERLAKYLPLTLQKLERKIPIHIALIGDEVAGMHTLDERNGSIFYSLNGYFLQGLEHEFFYTGGVKWLNPQGDQPAKLQSHLGNEISLETFTPDGATALHSLQALSTRVFLRPTDLVIIEVGLNDYRKGAILDAVTTSLAHCLAICRAKEAEMVIIGPTPLREGDALKDWGGIRQVASELRRAAEELGVMFLDPALDLMRTRPAAGEMSPQEKTIQLSNALRMDLLDYGPGKTENAWINARAHKRAGQGIFRQFLNGPPASNLRLGVEATRTETDRMKLDLAVENTGKSEESGILVPLIAGEDWEPAKLVEQISVKPGEKLNLSLDYQREKKKKGSGAPTSGRDRVASGRFCFPFLYSGLDETELLEVAVAPTPVSVRWNYTGSRGMDKQFPLTFVLCNSGDKPVRGSYELVYGDQRPKGNFSLETKGEHEYTVQCNLPATENQFRWRDAVVLKITSGEISFEERRGLEITRDLVLEQKVPLARWDKYAEEGTDGRVDGGISMDIRADQSSLLATFDLGDRVLEEGQNRPALLLDFTLDARQKDARHGFGFVSPLRISFGAQPGAGKVESIEPAAFGNFYGKILSEAGIMAQLGIREDGSAKTVTVRIPRIYLYWHEWKIGSADSSLGISARLRFLRVDPLQHTCDYPASQEWVTASGEYGEWNASGLASLALVPHASSPKWSVRLY